MLERVKRDKRCSSVRSDWASEYTGGWGHAGTMASAGGGHGRTPCGECGRCPRAGTAGGPERMVERLARAFRYAVGVGWWRGGRMADAYG